MGQMKSDCGSLANLDDGWALSSPQEQGLDPELVCSIGSRIRAWKEANVHGVVVVRQGEIRDGVIPIRVRGPARERRLDALISVSSVAYRSTPEGTAAAATPR